MEKLNPTVAGMDEVAAAAIFSLGLSRKAALDASRRRARKGPTRATRSSARSTRSSEGAARFVLRCVVSGDAVDIGRAHGDLHALDVNVVVYLRGLGDEGSQLRAEALALAEWWEGRARERFRALAAPTMRWARDRTRSPASSTGRASGWTGPRGGSSGSRGSSPVSCGTASCAPRSRSSAGSRPPSPRDHLRGPREGARHPPLRPPRW